MRRDQRPRRRGPPEPGGAMTVTRLMTAVLVAAAFAFGVTACGDDDDGGDAGATSGSSGSKDLKVGFSNKASDQFVLTMQNLAVDQIEEQGLSALQPVSASTDPGKQISDIQNLVSAGAQAMVVVPQDSSAIKPALDFLESKKIPTVALDT